MGACGGLHSLAGRRNPEGASFCMSCGAAFAPHCPKCGTVAPSRRASACRAAPRSQAGRVVSAPAAAEERRTVTVLFADLSGYTSVAEQLDPESLKGLLDQAMQRLGEEVTRFGGPVDKYIGDAVMALFGAPVAHEERPRAGAARGVRHAGRDARDQRALRSQHGASFELRVGLNTGEVLAGDVGHAYTVIGDAVNIAERLQSTGCRHDHRRPATLCARPRSGRYRELEPLRLKGKAERFAAGQALRVLDSAASPSRARAGNARRLVAGARSSRQLRVAERTVARPTVIVPGSPVLCSRSANVHRVADTVYA